MINYVSCFKEDTEVAYLFLIMYTIDNALDSMEKLCIKLNTARLLWQNVASSYRSYTTGFFRLTRILHYVLGSIMRHLGLTVYAKSIKYPLHFVIELINKYCLNKTVALKRKDTNAFDLHEIKGVGQSVYIFDNFTH